MVVRLASRELLGEVFMNRSLFLGLLTAAAAWLFYQQGYAAKRRKVPAQEAAARLREAWAKNHTTA